MKKILDWQSREIVNIYDELSLWSAPFGRLLLENIPMRSQATIVDIGFGTGFPLIELSQRFGESSQIIGIDIWPEGIRRTQEKLNLLELTYINIIEQSASNINLGSNTVDLITSNLGVNNFDEKSAVYNEIFRILKPAGHLCITTNPIGTFQELFDIFHDSFTEMKLEDELSQLYNYVQHRNSKSTIIDEIVSHGLTCVKIKEDQTNFRFVDADALFNHALMRIGFRSSWENMVRDEHQTDFFKRSKMKIQEIIHQVGEFTLTVPMLYLEFEKK